MPDRLLSDPSALRRAYEVALAQTEPDIGRFTDQLKQSLRGLGINAHVKGRFKKFESFFEKLHRAQRGSEPKAITDMTAFRVVCPFVGDLPLVENFLTENFTVLEIVRKGSGMSFREFGYESTHIILDWPWPEAKPHLPEIPGSNWVVEVQVRTILQDAWAEVEHELVYKGEWSLPDDSAKRKLAAINAALSLADTVFQELRSEVKAFRLQQERRRSLVQDKAHVMDQDHMSRTLQRSAMEHPEFLPNAGSKEKIEKFLMYALDAHTNENFEMAVEYYSRALSFEPEPRICSIILNHRGMSYFVLSLFKEAEEDFSAALEANAKNFRALNNRAACHRLNGDLNAALADYTQSIHVKKDQEDVHFFMAQCLFDMGEWSTALQSVDDALSLNPKMDKATQLKGKILARMMR